MHNGSQIKIGAILSYVSVALNVLTGIIYTPWMIEKIGSSQYGLYTLANSLISMFLMDFGLSSATARYVSNYRAKGEQKKVNNFLGMVYKLYLLIDAVILIVLIVIFCLIDTIYASLTPGELAQFKVVYMIAAAYSVISFPFVTLNGILTAYEKFIQLKLADVIYRCLLVVVMVVALSAGCGVYTLVTVHAVIGLLVIVYKLLAIGKLNSIKVNFSYSDRSLYKDIFGFSIWSTIAALSQRLVFNITPSILGIVSSSTAIAVFGVVITLESNIYSMTNAINGMFMPKISRIFAGEDAEKKIFPLMLAVGKFQYALTGLVAAGFLVLGKEFMMLWMGNAYMDAYAGVLLVIIPGMFYNALQIANTTVIVTKQIKYIAYVNVAVGVTNVAVCLLLAPQFGASGACISICIAYILRAVLLNLVYHKKLHLDMFAFAKKCYLRMSVPVLLTILLGGWINTILPAGRWGWVIAKAGLICLIYGVFIVLCDTDVRSSLMRKRCV